MSAHERPGITVTYRGQKRRLEVEMPAAMFEFEITEQGLVPGALFVNTGYDLRDITSVHYNFAVRAARDWLAEAWLLNPNI